MLAECGAWKAGTLTYCPWLLPEVVDASLVLLVGTFVVVAASACTTFDSVTPNEDGGAEDAGPTPSRDGAAGSCGPANCGGCCLGDVCQVGTSVSGCGARGGQCATCRAGQILQARLQACGVDLDSSWLVQAGERGDSADERRQFRVGLGPSAYAPPDVFVTMVCHGGNGAATRTPSSPIPSCRRGLPVAASARRATCSEAPSRSV